MRGNGNRGQHFEGECILSCYYRSDRCERELLHAATACLPCCRRYQTKERRRILNEVTLLKKLHHPNLIAFYGAWVKKDPDKVRGGRALWLIVYFVGLSAPILVID